MKSMYIKCIFVFEKGGNIFLVLELEIIFPKEKEEFIKLAPSFECKSSEGMMRGCVGAIDGFLATINRPTIVESGNNPGSFFSVTT